MPKLLSILCVLPFLAAGFQFPAQIRAPYRSNANEFQTRGISRFSNKIKVINSPAMKQSKLQSIHTISLDTAVLSGSKFGLQKLGFCLLLMSLAGNRLFKSLTNESEVLPGKSQSAKANSPLSVKTVIESFIKRFVSISESLSSKVLSSIDGVKNAATSVLGWNSGADIKLDDWSVCKLQQRESLFGGRYTRYRFELENSASKVPLYIGQEIVMCSTDSKGRILKENFFPISSSALRGYFEILVRRNTGGGAYDKFVRSLDSLEEGDEIAFKGGSYRLNYEGADDPIKYVTVVSAGVGIAPSLQILNGILSDRDSTVEDMEVLWMNSDGRDFVCDKDVVLLEKKYEKKLFVTRVNENKLFEQDFTQKDSILGALSAYETGRIAVLCGSDDVILKVKDLLLNVGYPAHSILAIST